LAGITLIQAEAQLTAWLAASTAVASGQAYSMSSGGSSRTLTRADAKEIRENIKFWNDMVKSISKSSSGTGGIATRFATPVTD
jgi:hypothetical protein